MKRLFFLVLTALCAVIGIYAYKNLPAENDDLIEKKYDTWAGVIRVWAAEECDAAGWLNHCAALAEKRLNGVYINVQQAPLAAIADYASTGINPPDVIVYPGSAPLETSGLMPITRAYPLRPGLEAGVHAVPLLIRPRFWIYDASVHSPLPGDMYDVRAACRVEDTNALTALCTGLRPVEGSSPVLPGVDLGLSDSAAATPQPAGGAVCRVSPEFILSDAPRSLYSEGDVDAFVGGISDALLLGNGRNTAAAVTGEYICGESAVLSIVSKGDGREAACMEYLDVLMSDGQAALARAKAFPAILSVSAWSGDILLGPAEAALEGRVWLQNASGDSEAARLYIEGKLSADEAIERIVGGK